MIQKLRISSLILVHILILLHIYYFGSDTIGSIDFQEFFHSFLKLGIINAGVILVIFAFIFTVIFGRFFCGWACHFGAIQELSWYLLKKSKIKIKTIDSKLVTLLPIIILLNFYIVPNILYSLNTPWNGISISLNEPEIWKFLPGFTIGLLTFFIDGFFIVYFLGKKGFCRFICPWGAFLKVPTSLSLFKVRKTGDCTHCHVCTSECPVGIDVSYEINTFDKVVNSNCTSCMNCTSGCPSNALSYKFENPFTEEYTTKQFKHKKNAFKHLNIVNQFRSIRKNDIIVLILTLIFGISIDSLYGMGHFMAYGIALISSFIIVESFKKESYKKYLICFSIFILFSWHGLIKYSIWQGLQSYNEGNSKVSIQSLERVVNIYPKKISKFHILLSEMYIDLNDFNNALKHANIAIKINPNHTAAKQLLDIIYKNNHH